MLGPRRAPAGYVASVGVALALGLGTAINNGDFSHDGLVYVALALACAGWGIFSSWRGRSIRVADAGLLLWGGLVAFVFIGWLDHHGIGSETAAWTRRNAEMWCALIVVCAYAPSAAGMREPRVIAEARFLLVMALALRMGVDVIASSPEPRIDVFQLLRSGAQALHRGENPYAVVSVPATGGPAPTVPYAYPPGSLLASWLTFEAFGDVRYAALGSVLVAGVLARATAKHLSPELPALHHDGAALLMVLFPKWPMIVQRAWVDPISLGLLAYVGYASVRGHRMRAAVALGLAISTKQPMFFFGFLAMALLRWRWRDGFLCAAVAAAVCLPFALANPAAFWFANYTFHAALPPRPDSLSMAALLAEMGGIVVPTLVPFALAASVVALAATKLRDRSTLYFLSAALLFLVFFTFGKQAFVNYHFFIAGLAALSMPLLSQRAVASADGIRSRARRNGVAR